VTRGWLPQRAGLLDLNGGGAAAAVPRDEIWHQKTRIMGLPDGEEIMTLAFFVLTQYRRVTDRQTDGRTRCCRKDPRYHSVARVKPSVLI